MKQFSSVDDRLEARGRAGRGRQALAALAPHIAEFTEDLLKRLTAESREKTLTNDQLRSMVGEISGVRRLQQKIEAIVSQADIIADRSDG